LLIKPSRGRVKESHSGTWQSHRGEWLGGKEVNTQAGPEAGVSECTWQKGSLGKMAATQDTSRIWVNKTQDALK